MASALWGVLTHPHCTPELETGMLGLMHMQQRDAVLPRRSLKAWCRPLTIFSTGTRP